MLSKAVAYGVTIIAAWVFLIVGILVFGAMILFLE